MIKAIFYKEWIKTRQLILLLCAIFFALLGYTWLNISSDFRSNGAVEIWGAAISAKYSLIPSILYYFPLVCGALIGLLQFSSEITNKRLKLTLHLPIKESRVMAALYLFGALITLSLSFLLFTISLLILSVYFPSEILIMTLPYLLLYSILGLSIYFIAAYIVVEPVWRRRVGAILISMGAIWAFFQDGIPNLYGLLFLLFISSLLVAAAYLSASRFKDGAQN